MKCEVWSVKFKAYRVECGAQSVECKVWRKESVEGGKLRI